VPSGKLQRWFLRKRGELPRKGPNGSVITSPLDSLENKSFRPDPWQSNLFGEELIS
jgi:hypothetical protein